MPQQWYVNRGAVKSAYEICWNGMVEWKVEWPYFSHLEGKEASLVSE